MQMAFYQLTTGGLYEKLQLNKLDAFSILLAAVCHDLGHDGFTNGYHVNKVTRRAIDCNDVSVQESFHASELFRILDNCETNILSNMSEDQFKVLRKRVIGLILATDMQKHMTDGGNLKALCESNEISNGKNVGKLFNPND
jgi:hypothetical protein